MVISLEKAIELGKSTRNATFFEAKKGQIKAAASLVFVKLEAASTLTFSCPQRKTENDSTNDTGKSCQGQGAALQAARHFLLGDLGHDAVVVVVAVVAPGVDLDEVEVGGPLSLNEGRPQIRLLTSRASANVEIMLDRHNFFCEIILSSPSCLVVFFLVYPHSDSPPDWLNSSLKKVNKRTSIGNHKRTKNQNKLKICK